MSKTYTTLFNSSVLIAAIGCGLIILKAGVVEVERSGSGQTVKLKRDATLQLEVI